MNPERWTRIEQLYHQVVPLAGVERARLLARACAGDAALRAEIESLLAEDPLGNFLEDPALSVAARLVADDIPVLTGRMWGPYRIDAMLGAGAMGDVYRAHDTLLGRDVAIKILPEAFSDDPDRLARFEKEAQFLASLSHPNIAAIYGMHECDGVRGLVLELVDGETLAERIARGPVPLYDLVRIIRQICEGLDAAHQRGIVHRDLKPSNIKIARDGTAKILDFGLAKSAQEEPDEIAAGTPSYMSPEQARGDSIDKRTDIWAFGCICFEMLTGAPAFRGHPGGGADAGPQWDRIPGTVPAEVTRLLKRCLDVDRKRRRRDIGDVLEDLDDALEERAAPAGSARRYILLAATVILLIAAGAVLLKTGESSPPTRSDIRARLSLLLPPSMDFPDRANQIAVSPDGTMVAYVAALAGAPPRLVLRKLDAESEQIIGDAIDVRDPFFSPDGRWVGFMAGDTIRKVSLADGRTRVVCKAPSGVTASWSHGAILFGEGGDHPSAGIRRVAEDGGTVEVVTRVNRDAGERNHLYPQLLPDGRTVIYTIRAIESTGTVYRVVAETPGTPRRVLVEDARVGRFVGDSSLIYHRGRSLHVTGFDARTLTTSGPGVLLFDDISPGQPTWASAGDVLAYRPQNQDRRLVWVGRNGIEVSISAPPKLYGAPSLSPSGDRVALEIDDHGKFDIWILDTRRQSLAQLTSDGASRYPMWTPDGAHLGLARRRENSVVLLPANGGELRELVRSTSGSWIGSWSPDMRTFVYMLEDPISRSDLWAVDLKRQAPPRPIVRTPAREYGGRISPDGMWLAYLSDEHVQNQFELYITPMVSAGPRFRVGAAGAREAVWAKNGRELFYRNGRQMLSVRIDGVRRGAEARSEVLFEGDYFTAGGPGIVNYDVSPDGQRFLMLKQVEADRTPHLTVVQGLGRLIRDRLPPAGR